MKITVLAGYFPPEQSADTRLNNDLAHSLAEMGADVTVVVPFPTRLVSKDVQSDYLKKKEETFGNLKIIRVGKPSGYHQNLFIRGIDFIKKSLALYVKAKKIETDVYLVISTPPFLGYVAAMLSKKKLVLYKLQDIFPDSLIHSKNVSEKSFLVRILRILEKWVYRRVQNIIAISEDMKRTLLGRGVPEDKIIVIYDWVDEESCYPVKRKDNYLFQKFNLDEDAFYVCYGGNIGFLQNIETIVKASEILAEQNSGIKFVIIGDGAWKPQLNKMLKVRKHENVFCFPMQPTDQIAYVYSLGDIGLVSLRPDVTKYALPSKAWDIMSAGRPVVCEIDLYSTLCNIVEQNECGYCVSPGDAEGLANAILSLFCNVKDARRMGNNGRQYIITNLTRNVASEKYLNVMKQMLSAISD